MKTQDAKKTESAAHRDWLDVKVKVRVFRWCTMLSWTENCGKLNLGSRNGTLRWIVTTTTTTATTCFYRVGNIMMVKLPLLSLNPTAVLKIQIVSWSQIRGSEAKRDVPKVIAINKWQDPNMCLSYSKVSPHFHLQLWSYIVKTQHFWIMRVPTNVSQPPLSQTTKSKHILTEWN